jgi:hypothetical protein
MYWLLELERQEACLGCLNWRDRRHVLAVGTGETGGMSWLLELERQEACVGCWNWREGMCWLLELERQRIRKLGRPK